LKFNVEILASDTLRTKLRYTLTVYYLSSYGKHNNRITFW